MNLLMLNKVIELALQIGTKVTKHRATVYEVELLPLVLVRHLAALRAKHATV